MRMIDADALKASIPETETDIFENCQRCTTLMDYEVKDLINAQPTIPASPWHRVEEPPKEGTWCVIAKHSYLQPHNLFYDIAHYLHGTFSVYDSGVGDWFDGKPLYWMPIEPPEWIKDVDDPPEFDPCYECGGYGDDYHIDEDGELVSNCPDCPFNKKEGET